MTARARRLDEIPPEEVLRRIRRRAGAAFPMSAQALRGNDLLNLARFHFGGWYEAVAAAGLQPEGRAPTGKRPARGRLQVQPLTEALLRGPLSSRELERRTGLRADTIRKMRLRRGIARDEGRKKNRTWLPAVRKLLGKAPDTEIARRAGVSPTLVARARRELGIPAFVSEGRPPEGDGAPLDRTPPAEVLRRIRARARSGRSMRATDVDRSRLRALADFHFRGWYEAVAAAGLVPEGSSRPRTKVVKPERLRTLTRALLRGPKSSRELERLTGIPRDVVRARREELGIHRDETAKKDRSWVPRALPLFGEVPDAEIARRVGVSAQLLGRVRAELGIAPCPRRSLATEALVREWLSEYEPDEIAAALRTVGRRAAAVLRRRVLAPEPETLDEVAARLGVSKQSVAWHERRGLAGLLAALQEGRERG